MDPIPPPEPFAVYRVAVIGTALAALAAILNPVSDHLNTVRLLLVGVGCLVAGSAVTMRCTLPVAWLLLAAAFALAYPGLPAHWDSARIVAIVGCAISLGGAALVAMPRGWRYSILSALALVHFGGIFCATTWPDPAPWTTTVLFGPRFYLPYLMFMYLRNAYHFYSPDPGPASHLFMLVKFVNKDGKELHDWVTLPNRREHMKDPLGLTYYRRLSISEQASRTMSSPVLTFELNDVQNRRLRVAGQLMSYPDMKKIPLAPEEFEPQAFQYRPPAPDISRYILPSYANHILKSQKSDEWTPVSVKIYRLEHKVMPTYYFVKKGDMDHPTTFRPFYLGEFAVNPKTGLVELTDPQDPMLYWLVPILPLPGVTSPEHVPYIDYMSQHAKFKYDWEKRTP